MPSFRQKSKIKIIGIREGEKIHEEMITIHDGLNTYDIENITSYYHNENTYKILNIFKKNLI